MNGVAVILFVIARKILVAPDTGDACGRSHRRLCRRTLGQGAPNPRYIRTAVSVISAAITIAFFVRHR